MRDNAGIDVFEITVTHKIRPAHQLLFRGTDRENHRACNLELLHRFLDCLRRPHGHSSHDVMAFHMSWRALDERLARNASGRLRTFR